MTKEQRKAIKRICADYDFEDLKELREWSKTFTATILTLTYGTRPKTDCTTKYQK